MKMRFLVFALLMSVNASAQSRFTVQDPPEPERRPQHEERAEMLEDIGSALVIAGVGFWALETYHTRAACGAAGECVAEPRGIYTWSTVAAWSGAAVAFGWKLSLARGSVDLGVGRVQYSVGW